MTCLASLVAWLVKNRLQCRRPRFHFWVRKIRWRRDRLPTPVILGFPGGWADKKSACNAGDLGLIPGLGRVPRRMERLPTPIVFWPGEFHGLYRPWGCEELDTTERLSLTLLFVSHLCPILCDPMDCSAPGFPVLHHLPEPAQTHVFWVGYAIQPSHPLSSSSPPAFNLSQHQGLF